MTFLKLGESPADMSHRLCVGGKEARFPGAFRSINYMAKKICCIRLCVGGKETRFPGAFSLLHQTVSG